MSECDPLNITLTNYSTQCDYVSQRDACVLDSGFINYYKWQFCGFDNSGPPTFFMIVWLMILLVSIGITADSFFAPCLVVVTRILRMSQNLAGVTLLALGNGAADVFSSLSAVTGGDKPNVGLSLGAIIGAGILVNTVTAGIIMIIKPFQISRRPIIKDLVFYLIALILCMVVLITKKMTILIAANLLVLYVIYVFTTALGRIIYVKWMKKSPDLSIERQESTLDNPESSIDQNISPEIFYSINDQSKLQNFTSIRLVKISCTHDNPSFDVTSEPQTNLAEPSNSIPSKCHLATPRFNNFENERKPTEIADKRITSLIQSNSLRKHRSASSSHRTGGFLAKIVMAHEYQKIMVKSNKEIEIKLPQQRQTRAKSFDASENNPETKKIRFLSCTDIKTENLYPSNRNSQLTDPSKDNFKLEVPNHNSSNRNSKISCNNENFERPSTDSILNKDITGPQDNLEVDVVLTDQNYKDEPFPSMLMHFLLTIIPFDLDSWSEMSIFDRIWCCAQSPIVFILTLCIPVVDDSSFNKGWCKMLNALHCFVSPIVWVVLLKFYGIHLGRGGFTVAYLFVIVGFLVGVLIFFTSEHDKPPKYQAFFAFIGFLTSVVFIYATANEIVNILEVFGKVFSIPDTVLGLSILAVANSIGDLVSNIMLARRNFPRIAYAACVGGPLFNLLIGVGLPFCIVTTKNDIEVEVRSETVVLLFTIMLITVLNIIVLPSLRFKLRLSYGIILIMIYVVFIILVLLFATNIINVTVP